MLKRRMTKATMAAVLAAACLTGGARATAHGAVTTGEAATGRAALPAGAMLSAMSGGNTYGGQLREAEPRADGYRHIDTPALIAKLKAMRANTYTFGIWESPKDWDDLHEFLPKAKEAGIQVMAYIVPPSECADSGRCSRPFMRDYVKWAEAIATLSKQYPDTFTSWGIDDFDLNPEKFTQDYMRQIVDKYKGINPRLKFYCTTYYGNLMSDAYYSKYAPYVDGFIYPYLEGPYNNTADGGAAPEFLNKILAKTQPRGEELIFLVYANRFLGAIRNPDEAYVKQAIGHGMSFLREGKIKGIIAYGTSVDGKPALPQENKAMYGNGRLSLSLSVGQSTQAGHWTSASQTVTVNPDAPRHELSFWHHDIYESTPQLKGFHFKQVLLDGQVIYEEDIMDGPLDTWIQGHPWQGAIDVTSRLKGKISAKLEFRLYDKQGVSYFPVDVSFDHIETIGFTVKNQGFETRGDWFMNANNYPMNATYDIWHADRPQRIFDAVASEYGAAATRRRR